MWRRRYWRFYFGFPPLSYFRGSRPFPSKEEYLSMLEEYKKDLEDELREVQREIEEVKKESSGS